MKEMLTSRKLGQDGTKLQEKLKSDTCCRNDGFNEHKNKLFSITLCKYMCKLHMLMLIIIIIVVNN